ncbi:MAG: hypothetical protein ACFFF4_15160, partial [Candidatus Thorarchaeota archaeon]
MRKRREIAEHLDSEPNEFESLLEEIFHAPEDIDTEERALVLNLLDFLNDRLAISVIQRALIYPDAKVRVKGLQAAYRRQVDSLNNKIEEILRNSEEIFTIRKLAIHILGSTDPTSFGRLLRNIMKNDDEDIELRKEAIFALTNNPSNETVGAL